MTDSWPELMTAKQAAERLLCSTETLRKERKAGKIGFTRIAGRILYKREHVLKYIEDGTEEAKPCLDRTKAPDCGSIQETESITYTGLQRESLASVQRVQGICRRLKKGSPSSSSNSAAGGPKAPVIPLTSR